MGDSEQTNDIAELATEAVAPIEQELRRRLVAELGEQDVLAVETALLKAFIGGMGAGLAEAAEPQIEQGPIVDGGPFVGGFASRSVAANASFERQVLPDLDPWAERYREDG